MLPGNKKSSDDIKLEAGSIVLYEHNGTPLLGVIKAQSKSKFLILNQRKREVQLAANRLRKIPGSVPSEIVSSEDIAEHLDQLESSNKETISPEVLEEIWKFVAEEEREYSISELCDLYYGDNSTNNHLALAYNLLSDRIFFKRVKDKYKPRPLETIEELRKAEDARQRKINLQKKLAEQFLSKTKDADFEFDEELLPFVSLLEEIAAQAPHIDNTRQKDAKDLLALLQEALNLELRGNRHDQAYKVLKDASVITRKTDPAISRHRPQVEFEKELLTAADSFTQELIEEKSSDRLDLTHLECITIDDTSTKDMDDALSLEETESGYRLGIHISDVASLIEIDSILDQEARERGTSIYLPSKNINMLPEHLSHNLCSLVEGEKRLCLSCLFEVTKDFEVTKGEIKPTVIKVTRKYSYDEVDELLQTDQGLLFKLYNIAGAAEAARFANGGAKIPKTIAQAKVDEKGFVELVEVDENGPARSLIGEMMILANTLYADYAVQHSLPVLFRSQEPPEDDSPIDPSIPDGPAALYAVKSRLKRSVTSFEPGFHSTLGVEAYLQSTSPIRRYLDLVLQRQFLAHLATGEAFYSEEALSEIHSVLNEHLPRANTVTRDSIRFWLLRWLEQNKRRSTTIKATVLRTDMRNPMVELDELYVPWIIKTNEPLRPGDELQLKITGLNAWGDYMRLELV